MRGHAATRFPKHRCRGALHSLRSSLLALRFSRCRFSFIIHHSVFLIFAILLATSACAADPTVTVVDPATGYVGQTFTLNVYGTNFVTGAKIRWNGADRVTTVVSATQVRMTVGTSDLSATGTAQITVKNPAPDGTSNAVALAIVNPAPTASSLTPTSVFVGAADTNITVGGTGFVSSSTVQWNGVARPTTYISSGQVRVTIPASDLAVTGSYNITVTNPTPGGGISTARAFTVNNPVPNLSSIFPSEATIGGPDFILEATGLNFVNGAVVKWKGTARTTTFVSETLLRAQIPASDLAAGGTASVTVTNPTPGGGTSAGKSFSVNHPVPGITGLSPTSVTALGAAFTLTVNGTGFVSGAAVQWNRTNKTTTYVNPTQLTAAIPITDIVTGGMVKIGVTNPIPGGGTSTTLDFTVNNPLPSVGVLTPATANAGGAGFSLTVDGANFVSTSVVYWNGVPRPTSRTSATRLVATIPASDIAVKAPVSVTVVSPAPGGGASGAQSFTITDNPLPVLTSVSPASTTVSSPGFALTVNGSNFVVGSVVRWGAEDLTTTYVSGTTLTAQVPSAHLTSTGTFNVTVFNPLPGGGTSAVRTFQVLGNPVSTISTILPTTTTVGTASATVTVNGTNFVNSSVVNWNGAARTTTFVSSTKLTVVIPGSDLTATGTATITVVNPSPGGGTSNGATFSINNPVPVLTSLSSGYVTVNDPQFTMTLTGSNFVSGSVVRWAGSNRATTYVSKTQLTAVIPASDLTGVGSFSVTVYNPAPGGGTSTARSFTVRGYPVPSASSVTPNAATAGGTGFTLTVKGSNFIPLSVANWNGFARVTSYVSATELTVTIPALDIGTGGSGSVTVTNPTPGGGTSSTLVFTINNPLPTIASLLPVSEAAGEPAFALTVNGTNFVGASKVRWNGAYRTTTFVSATQLTADIPATDITAGTIASISVFSPSPGGGLTSNLSFTVDNPVPVITGLVPETANVGMTGIILTVNGTHFVSGSTVFWDGRAKTTTYVDGTQLTAAIPSSDLTSTGGVNITVVNSAPSGGTSTPEVLSVVNPAPTLSGIAPTSVTAAGSAFTLTIDGTDFLESSVVRWNGSDRPTTWVNSMRLTATISATDIEAGGTASVTVHTPAPGGGTSAIQSMTMNNPVPTLTTLGPSCAGAGGEGFALTVQGGSFVNGSIVRWNGSDRVTTYVSGTRLSAAITAEDIATAGSATVTVFSPAPGGGTSGGLTVTVAATNPAPSITSITPTATTAGNSGLTLQVVGGSFVAGSIVRWDGLDRATTVLSSTQLEATIPASDLVAVKTVNVTVFSPTPGGGTSNAKTFTINSNPIPALSSISPISVLVGSGARVLTLNGANLNTTSTAYWNAAPLVTTYVSGTKVTAVIPAARLSAVGTATVTVGNPVPGGGVSGSQTFTISPNPSPNLSSLNPSARVEGTGAFTLFLTGSSFSPDSVVRWNGADRPTTYVSSTQLTADIPAEDMTTVGTVSVTVFSPAPGGGTSAAVTFTVNNPVPSMTLLTPSVVTAGSEDFILSVDGTHFVPSSQVKWKGAVRTTTYVSATRLTAEIPAADVVTGGSAAVTVYNPAPGGGSSANVNLTISNPDPNITSINPTSATAGDPGFALEVNGTHFVGTSIVRWNGTTHTTSFVNSTRLTASISSSDLSSGGTVPVVVFSPTPGGGTSSSQTFTINYPVPTLTSISPVSAVINDPAVTLTVNGDNFYSGAVVQWNGENRTTSFSSKTKLTAVIPATDLDSPGTATVRVVNPVPGGGVSVDATFTVNAYPVPVLTGLSQTSTTVGSPGFTLTVNGTSFYSGITVQWNGDDRATTFVSATRVTATVLDADVASVGTAQVTVMNPSPGGGASSEVVFNILPNSAPSISSLSPSFALAGSGNVTLTVNGASFVSDSVVRWNGADLVTTFSSSIKLVATIPAAEVANADTADVEVFSPEPGGGVSSVSEFSVNNRVPTLSSIFPTTVPLQSPPFNLGVTGTNFVTTSTVLWNGASRPTTYVSATQLTALIPVSDMLTAGSTDVTVNSPTPGGGTTAAKTISINNPIPSIASLSPASGVTEGPAFTLTVNGQDFVNGAVVQWGGEHRTTTLVSATQLQADITLADMVASGPVDVTVANPAPGGGTSAASVFQRNGNPAPTLVSLSPSLVAPGSGAFTLTMDGTNFVAGSVVRWNGIDRATTFVSDTQLTASILAADVVSAGAANVTVFSAAPGGGTTAPATLTIGYPVPVPSDLSPISCLYGGGAFTLTVNGSAFQSISVVRWNGVDRTTTYVSGTQLTAQILAADVATAGTALVTVYTPGGGISGAVTFTMGYPVPVIASLNPPGAESGGAGFTLTVEGSGFAAASQVQWNASSRTTAYVSATRLTATIDAADVAAQGMAMVTVVNPTPGGGTSNAASFPIAPRYTLALTVSPPSGGTITADPGPGLDMKYAAGTVVDLTANPTGSYLFTGWTGDVVSAQTTIQVTMDANRSVTANFFLDSNLPPVIDSLPWADPNPVEFPGTTGVHVIANDPDSQPSPLSYTWEKVTGTGDVSFSPNGTPAAEDSVARFGAAGEYLLRVTVTDGGKTDTDTVTITVTAANPPSSVSDLVAVQGVQLSWTAPGDDGASGTADRYEVRYGTAGAIDDETKWAAATERVVGVPTPGVAGTAQSMTIDAASLPGEMVVYFSVRAVDGVGNLGGLSNSPGVTIPGIAPAAVSTLATGTPTVSSFVATFTAVGDDGTTGTATTYDLRYSTSPLSESNWASATQASDEPAPKAAGQAETILVNGLAPDTMYYVGLKVADELSNWSGLSNVASIKTVDETLPSAVSSLSASLVSLASAKVTGVTATSSSNYSATYSAAKAVDGSTSTYWRSGSATAAGVETLTLDLGSLRLVEKVRMRPRTTYYQWFPKDFTIELSADGTDFVTVHTETGYTPANGVWCERSFALRSAQYVRLRAQRVYYSRLYRVEVSEMEAYTPTSPVSLTSVGVTATSSSNYSATFSAAKAVDGSTSTFWRSGSATAAGVETLTLDLGSLRMVEKVRMRPRTTYYRWFPQDFTIELSADGTDFVTVHTETGYTPANGVWCERSFALHSAQYVRLRAQRVYYSRSYRVEVSEMEAYASTSPSVRLDWMAPGDNGAVGTATSYEVKYSTDATMDDETKWTAATALAGGVPAPAVAGTAQSMTIPLTGLGSPANGTTIHFCVRARDEANNQGELSNDATATVP